MFKDDNLKFWFSVAVVAAVAALIVFAAPGSGTAKGKHECNDGFDNDGDGAVDLADAGCGSRSDNDESNCGDGVCEGGESSATCTADCQPADTCNDSDGGFVVWSQGAVQGINNGQPYSFTDHCNPGGNNTDSLREYYCSGSNGQLPQAGDVNCAAFNFTTCFNGACV